jgi:hypothetical protein
MSRSPYQFTIGQLAGLIAVCAFLFWFNGVSDGVLVLGIWLFITVDNLVLAQTGVTMGIGRSTLCRCLVLFGFAIAYCPYAYFLPKRHGGETGVFLFVFTFFYVTAPLCRAVISRLYKAVSMRGYQMPPTDESCGPIVLRGFGGGQIQQALSSVRAVEASGAIDAESRS